jgi:hypothetical protein
VPAAALCDLEAAPGDPLDLFRAVLHRVEDGAVGPRSPLAVVEAADELPHDDEVDAVGACRAEVRVDVELPAEADQPVLGPHLRAVELRRADRPHEDRVGGPAGGERLGRERVAGLPDRRSAEAVLFELEPEGQLPQHAGGDRANLDPDPVAGEEDDPHGDALVTAPSEADDTSAAYFANTPVV